MPEFQLEKSGPEIPILVLPPSGVISDGVPPVRVFVQIGKADAGCYICRRPIPKGTSRISFVVSVAGQIDVNTGKEATRRNQRYNVHPGCLTRPMGSEIVRHGLDCYDCGSSGEPGSGWEKVFTTHRFSYGQLCTACQRKPKWRSCGNCNVYFPQHMVTPGKLERFTSSLEDGPTQVEGDWCCYCAERFGIATFQDRKEHAELWEETRRRIIEEGVFDE